MENNKDRKYLIVVDGKPRGPYTLEELKTQAIRPGTFVRTPGMDDYKEAQEFTELRELFGFSYLKTTPQYFASFDQRLLASVIDHFLVFIVYSFLVLISFIFITEQAQRITVFLSLLPLVPIAKLIYGSFAEASADQGTAGKRLLKIKVTDMQGNPVTLANSFGRNFAKILSVAPLFFGFLYSFLNKKQQCWHDIVANTLVIKDRLI